MRKVALALMLLAGIGAIAVGVRYALAQQFMPYHEVIAGKPWGQLEPGVQAILRGMLKILGAGFAAFGVALLAFAWGGARGDRWPAVASAVTCVVIGAPTLYVTLFLRTVNARAETPVLLTLVLMGVTLAGSLLLWIANAPARRDVVDTQATTVQPA